MSVHSWNMAEQKWDKIGDVVGAAGGEQNSGKKLHNGKEYDYVFDIEIDEPKCTLKLPYNMTDSPYMAAQQFIHKHDLSQFYLDEIAQHIVKNTGGQSLGTASGGNFDPLTGGTSYHSDAISGGGPAAGGGAGGSYDPFTGNYMVSLKKVSRACLFPLGGPHFRKTTFFVLFQNGGSGPAAYFYSPSFWALREISLKRESEDFS